MIKTHENKIEKAKGYGKLPTLCLFCRSTETRQILSVGYPWWQKAIAGLKYFEAGGGLT
jgi:hypothetical protein